VGSEIDNPSWTVRALLAKVYFTFNVDISYFLSLILKRVFMFKCTLPMLRLTVTLSLLGLPVVLSYLLCFHKRIRPPTSILAPIPDAIILSLFPMAWFFGFLYYTEVPSLLFVAWMFVAAVEDRHWQAALVRSLTVVLALDFSMPGKNSSAL
jgi:hypothetical protein